MASHIECRFNKNFFLECYFLAILPAGLCFVVLQIDCQRNYYYFKHPFCFCSHSGPSLSRLSLELLPRSLYGRSRLFSFLYLELSLCRSFLFWSLEKSRQKESTVITEETLLRELKNLFELQGFELRGSNYGESTV